MILYTVKFLLCPSVNPITRLLYILAKLQVNVR